MTAIQQWRENIQKEMEWTTSSFSILLHSSTSKNTTFSQHHTHFKMNAPSTPGKAKRASVRSRTSQSPSNKSPRLHPYEVREHGSSSDVEGHPSQPQASHIGDATLVVNEDKEEEYHVPPGQSRSGPSFDKDATELSDDSDDDLPFQYPVAGSTRTYPLDSHPPPSTEETRLQMVQTELAWVRERIMNLEQLWNKIPVTRDVMQARTINLEPQYQIYADLTAQLDTEWKQFLRIASWQFGRQSTSNLPQSK